MTDLKQVATQTLTEVVSSPKTGLAVGGFSGFLSSIDPSAILTTLSIVLVTVSLVNQINIIRDRKKATTNSRRKGD